MKKLMAANWKMNKTWAESTDSAAELVSLVLNDLPEDREVLVTAPFTSIKAVSDEFKDIPGFSSGGQNLYPEASGAFTGEISPDMLKGVGATYCLAGHSERRHVMGESDEFVGKKVAFGLENGLSMILCIGELIEERKAGKVEEVLKRQMDEGLKNVAKDVDPARIVLAYEPVWAIGTGEVAEPKDIVEAHTFVRKELQSVFGDIANEIRILYGGSVKPANASQILELDNVDGVLVGGASLAAESFSKIVLA